jgi:hypothetical protein
METSSSRFGRLPLPLRMIRDDESSRDATSSADPMTESLRRSRLFFGSYALLFSLLALRFQELWLEIACAALATIGFADMAWIVFGVSRRTAAEPIRLAAVEDAGPAIAGYLATYLLPFLTTPQPTDRDLAAYLLFLFVTGLIFVRSEMTQVNPTLYVLGRRVVKITTDRGWEGYVVMRSNVGEGAVIRAVPLNSQIRVEAKAE